MEVHVPEHPIHTWREFLIHMGTICLGLLIAIALEQSVEALHHRHQLHVLREALQQDDEKTVADCRRIEAFIQTTNARTAARTALVRTTYASHQPITEPQPTDATDWDIPTDATWKAAKASGLLALMPQDEIKIHSEIDSLTDLFENSFPAYAAANVKVARFETRWRLQSASSAIPPEEMQTYLDLLADKTDTLNFLLVWAQQLHGASEAILHGERNLDRIQEAERKYSDKP